MSTTKTRKKKTGVSYMTLGQWRHAAQMLKRERDHAEQRANSLAKALEESQGTAQQHASKFAALQLAYNNLHAEIGKAADRTRKQVRVLRLVEIAGEREAVEKQVRQSIHGTVDVRHGEVIITAVTLHEYPEILNVARMSPSVLVSTDRSLDGELAKGQINASRDRQ